MDQRQDQGSLQAPRSPSLQRRIIDHTLETENKKNDNTWKSMCLTMDRRAVQYFTQISIIAGIMCFCILQLASDDRCESQQLYIGLLTLLIGVIAPSPKFK